MAVQYTFRKITTVHTADEFINTMLSRTQRRTPTVIRRHFAIARIRKFYMRKVTFIRDQFVERFNMILEEFPKIDCLHPFYTELLHTLYERDHYKIALGQIRAAVNLITKIGSDYVKLLKYGDSLFRCKKLKKAAMGRMVTVVKKLSDTFVFLEDVRQHIQRLPTIDPEGRTLILCGCPNAGKSSFINLLTRADVEVQPYAFTTKSLYVGRMDYNYLDWQIVDTPGILDREFSEMNTIELQAVTALTHIKCCVVFFVDISEMCGVTIEKQLNIFKCLEPIFSKKPMVVALNKTDVTTLEKLSNDAPEKRAAIKEAIEDKGHPLFEISTLTTTGVMDLRNCACERLLAHRIGAKLQDKKAHNILNRVYVAVPKADGKPRPVCVPPAVRLNQQQKKFVCTRKEQDPSVKLEMDIEEEQGFDYQLDYNKHKDLANSDWKYDKIPRFMDGKNIADFITSDFEKKLTALRAEEQDREAAGFYDSPDDEVSEQDRDFLKLAKKIRDKIVIDNINRRLDYGKGMRPVNRASRSRTKERTTSALRNTFENLGVDMSGTADAEFTRTMKRKRSVTRDRSASPIKRTRTESVARMRSRSASRPPRGEAGEPDAAKREKLSKLTKKSMKKRQARGAQVESDRKIVNLKPKHLLSGKRGIGGASRR